ncbi:hypothetical protein OROMI_006635 [Orobanche minor]
MTKKARKAKPEDQSPPYDLEYRAKEDDAWYSVSVVFDSDAQTLTVKYLCFPEVLDVVFSAGGFETEVEAEELVRRFRPLSQQVQDHQCGKLAIGTTVCAAHGTAEDDLRFYDAVIEAIHNKKRNRLAQKRLNDLVYVKYNRALKRRYEARDRIDPITLKDIDDSNEWLTGVVGEENQEDENDFVFDDDSLTWGAVVRASGAGEEAYSTRSVRGKGKNVVGSTSFAKSRTKQVEKGNTSHKRVPRGLRDEEEEIVFEEGEA